MTYTGGTSNMLNHLKLKDSSDISGWFTPEKKPFNFYELRKQ
jgi:hypothetical protein